MPTGVDEFEATVYRAGAQSYNGTIRLWESAGSGTWYNDQDGQWHGRQEPNSGEAAWLIGDSIEFLTGVGCPRVL